MLFRSKVSSNDSTAGYLNGKLVAGANITLTENGDGGNETLTVAATGGGTPTLCFTKGLFNPADVDRYLFSFHTSAFTVSEIGCIVDPADSAETVVLALYEADASGDFTSLAVNGLDGATTITCDVDGAADDGSLSNPSIAANVLVGVDLGVVTGTVTLITFWYCGS